MEILQICILSLETNNFTLTEDERKIRELYRIVKKILKISKLFNYLQEKEEIQVESQPNKNNVDFIKGSTNTWFQFNNNFMLYLSLAILTTMLYSTKFKFNRICSFNLYELAEVFFLLLFFMEHRKLKEESFF